MGKGNKPAMVLTGREKKAGDAAKKGCNSPMGCLKNEDPPIDCSRNPDYVKVICDNEKCTYNQYLHQECYDAWEAKIIIGVQKCQGHTRDWTDEQVRRHMWKRIWNVAYRYCKCECGSHLKRADAIELVEEPQAAAPGGGQRNEPKPKKTNQAPPQAKQASAQKCQPLPKLTQPSKNTYTSKNGTSWLGAGYKPTNDKNTVENARAPENDVGQEDNYIPGLFVNKEKRSGDRHRHVSASSTEATLTRATPEPYHHTHVSQPVAWRAATKARDEDDWRTALPEGKKDPVALTNENAQIPFGNTIQADDAGDRPSTSGNVRRRGFSACDVYPYQTLEGHARLSETFYDPQPIYGRVAFEIKSLVDELNAAFCGTPNIDD